MTRRSCRSARARSPTRSTRPPATRPTSSGTTTASSPTRSRRARSGSVVNPDTGAIPRRDVGFQPCFGAAGHRGRHGHAAARSQRRPLMVNEGHDQAMEFAEGNFGLIQGALEYSQRRHGAGRRRSSSALRRPAATRSTTGSTGSARRRSSTTRRTARRRRTELAEVRGAGQAPPGPGADAQRPGRPHRQVDRRGPQGQHRPRSSRSACWSARRGDGHRRRHRAGDAGALARARGVLRRVHAGRRAGLHGVRRPRT